MIQKFSTAIMSTQGSQIEKIAQIKSVHHLESVLHAQFGFLRVDGGLDDFHDGRLPVNLLQQGSDLTNGKTWAKIDRMLLIGKRNFLAQHLNLQMA